MKKFDDPDFSGIKYGSNEYEIHWFLVVLIRLILLLTPIGLLATAKNDDHSTNWIGTWVMRLTTAFICYLWYILFFKA